MLIRNTPTLTLTFNNKQRFICSLVSLLSIFLFIPTISIAQLQQGSFVFEGYTRTYLVYLPPNYNGVDPMPVVFNLHGWTLDMMQQMNYSKMNAVADTAGFIVVYPNAVDGTWNSGIYEYPGAPPNPNINDVGFIDALIDTLAENYSIDLKRIYSCGFSNGGLMSFKLACQLSNRITAIATVAGIISYKTASDCNCSHSMPVLMINGTDDQYVPYNGITGWHSVQNTLNHWVNYNLCSAPDTILMPNIDSLDGCTVQKLNYPFCSDSISVIFYKVINGGHTWPGGDKQQFGWSNIGNTNGDINVSKEIWNFFKNYKLSEPTKVTDYSQQPVEFSLFQNYPNPFNPSTVISYQLAVNSQVTLKVYNVLGNEVATLVNEEKPTGVYEVEFNTSNLASGVYFYQLQAGTSASSGQGFLSTKKMSLLK